MLQSKISRAFVLVLSLFISVFFTACGGGGGGDKTDPKSPVVTHVTNIDADASVIVPSRTVTTEHGKMGTIQVAPATGFENVVATGMNATMSGSTCTFGPVNADGGTVQLRANKIVFILTTKSLSTGLHFDQASVSVPYAESTTLTGTLDAGWSNVSIQAPSGITGTLTTTGQTFTYVISAVKASGELTGSAEKVTITETVTTKSLVSGVHFNLPSISVEHGASLQISGSLDAGWNEVTCNAPTGLAGTVSVSGSTFTYTIPAVLGSGEVTATGLKAVPVIKGKVAFVVAADIAADMQPLLTNFMTAVGNDLDMDTVQITSPDNPLALRNALKDLGPSLKVAYLIGNVPIVKRRTKYAASGSYISHSPTDHYYRALNFSYEEPVRQDDGTFFLSDSHYNNPFEVILPEFCATITVARIIASDNKTDMRAEVRAYLEKNLRLRNNVPSVAPGVSVVEAFAYYGQFSLADTELAYANHFIGPLSLTQGKTPAESESAFKSVLRTTSYVKVDCDGSPIDLVMSDDAHSSSLVVNGSSLVTSDISARYLYLNACYTGDFTYPNALAPRLVEAGDLLLVSASTMPAYGQVNENIHHAFYDDVALGIGRTLATTYPYVNYYFEEMHFLGDPSIALVKPVRSSAPRLVIDDFAYGSEFAHNVQLTDTSASGVSKEVTFRNAGDAELIIRGSIQAMYNGTVVVDQGNGGRVYWTILPAPLEIKNYREIRIPAGGSQTIRLLMDKVLYGRVATGTFHSYFQFSCNDPRVGGFRIDAVGTLQ